MMKKWIISILSLGFLSMTGMAYAQYNNTNRAVYADDAGEWGCGGNMGYGHGHQGRMWQNGGNGHRGGYRHQGVSLMSHDEFMNHKDKLYSAKNYQDCQSIQKTQYNMMLKRAKEQKITLSNYPPEFGLCERLNDRGYFNK